jgi:hypothetical protein
MHNHTEKTCKHDLRVCADCGNVYCVKCNREWFKERYYTYPYTVYYGNAYTNPSYGTITVSGTNITDGDAVQPTHTHTQ